MTMTAKKTATLTTTVQQTETTNNWINRQFEAVFLEHWQHVYAALLRLVGDHAEAEDLALETFMRLYQREPSPSLTQSGDGFNVGGWLHRVATNLGLNAIRSWKRRQRYELEAGRVDLPADPQTNPAEIFASEEQNRRARRILSEMNPRQAQLLILRHSGMAYREVATALGVSAASIGPLLARAEVEFERRYRAIYPQGEDYAPE